MADNVTLVTGASGFLGKAVMTLLAEQKQHAIGLDPRPSATTQVVDDLSDHSKLTKLLTGENVTHVIHSGGVSGPMVLADDPVKVITINVLGSLNLLYAAMDAGVRTFIYCSSAAALGSFYESAPVDESYPLRPNNTYSASGDGNGAARPVGQDTTRSVRVAFHRDLRAGTRDDLYGRRDRRRGTHRQGRALLQGLSIQHSANLEPQTSGHCQSRAFEARIESAFHRDIAAAAAAAGKPVRIEIDASKPKAERGLLDIEPAVCDFGFRAQVGHREGVRRLIEAAR